MVVLEITLRIKKKTEHYVPQLEMAASQSKHVVEVKHLAWKKDPGVAGRVSNCLIWLWP